ncbi:MAG: response regulator [Chloroflexi bacterium]|nr:response regulator [Chloroflexota bacterium]MBV9599062.1 response regulator [Chloroflexota bacterium]
MIVDDEKPVRQFLVAAFEEEGHKVLEASHGRQALSVLASTSTQPDLVISDVMMPLVGGLELCGILKADPSTADIPVILMSAAHPRAGTLTASDADAVIAKPFDLDTLDGLVRRLLSAHNQQDA